MNNGYKKITIKNFKLIIKASKKVQRRGGRADFPANYIVRKYLDNA